jgi:hypothetical protein
MDQLTTYIELIKTVITEWTETGGGNSEIESLQVFDDDHQQYMLVSTGWTPKTREHVIIFHARVREGKIWIEWDGTAPSITEALIERGIPVKQIVFNWHDPDVRTLANTQASHA